MAEDNLKFSPSILARLGEELLPNIDQGIIELVRNSFDADASYCKVILENITSEGGSVKIVDDGKGMDLEAIRSSWLVIGGSNKRGAGVTRKGRVQVGDKGLGRLAALRLGEQVVLKTHPEMKVGLRLSNQEFKCIIKWKEFDNEKTVDKVSIDIDVITLAEPIAAGTEISILDVKRRVSKTEAERLAKSLLLLSNPFKDNADFKVELFSNDYPELEKMVEQGYMKDAEWNIKASVSAGGTAFAEVVDWKNEVIWSSSSIEDGWFSGRIEKKTKYQCPQSEFELSIFILDKDSFSTRSSNVTTVTNWLKALGGVHIYHNGFRVHPYGDPGADWLEMNLARVNTPIRPSTNNSIGRVLITDPEKVMQQKTDRMGFIDSFEFEELKRFVNDVLTWYSRCRQRDLDSKKEASKSKADSELKESIGALHRALNVVESPEVRKEIQKAIKKEGKAQENLRKHLESDLKLYRSLATAGTISAVFSHEVSKPLSEIPINLESAGRLIKDNCEDDVFDKYTRRSSNVLRYLERLGHFAKLQLNLLKKDKRRNGVINVSLVVESVVSNFSPLLSREKIEIKFEKESELSPKLLGSVCILEAILTNCFTNSIKAFQRSDCNSGRRTIVVSLASGDGVFIMSVKDSGPGIKGIGLDDIWLPGQTTYEEGTGFGLSIIKDSVSDLGGRSIVEANCDLGGAAFYFEFKNNG